MGRCIIPSDTMSVGVSAAVASRAPFPASVKVTRFAGAFGDLDRCGRART
jgi:hypothetical protein